MHLFPAPRVRGAGNKIPFHHDISHTGAVSARAARRPLDASARVFLRVQSFIPGIPESLVLNAVIFKERESSRQRVDSIGVPEQYKGHVIEFAGFGVPGLLHLLLRRLPQHCGYECIMRKALFKSLLQRGADLIAIVRGQHDLGVVADFGL